MRRPLLPFALSLILTGSVLAQDPPIYTERIDVRIANVDIVVTDRSGKVVTGLTSDDFELVAGGVPQKIVNFYEAAGAGPGATPGGAPAASAVKTIPRRIILFVDNTSLTANHRKSILEQVRNLLGQTLTAGDETMIVTYDRTVRVRIPFTSDQDAVRTMLDVIAGEPGGGDLYRTYAMSAQNEILATRNQDHRIRLAKGYAENARDHLDRSIAALKQVMETVAGVDGRKVMILATEGLPVHPGMEMFQFLETLYAREFGRDSQEPATTARVTTIQRGGTNQYMLPPDPAVKYKQSSVTEMRTYDSRDKIRELSRVANAYGVALYPLHGGTIAGANMSDVNLKSSGSVSTVFNDLRANTENAMRIMADETGGIASVGSQHATLFSSIRSDLTSYYSLGFRASEPGEREIKVRVRKPGRYNVRYRHTLLQKPVEQELSDRVVANLFASAAAKDANLGLQLGATVPHAEGKVRVPVKITVPYEWLALLEKAEDKTLSGAFEVYIAVVDANGGVSPVARRTQAVVVRDPNETRGKVFPYTMQFLMNSNARRVSVAVMDTTTQLTSFASQDVVTQ